MEKEEIWRDIDGYEMIYQVSNMGRVKRVKGYDSLGHLRNEKILSPVINKDGYLKVGLCKEGNVKMFLVHRLVAQVFIPNPEGLPQINHRDEDKTNNRVDNLEWCEHRYNCNFGTRNERRLQTMISKGLADPELCGIDGKEHKRLYYQKNREKELEYKREYRQKNREKILEYQREYYREYRQKNREKILEHQREYSREYRRRKKSA